MEVGVVTQNGGGENRLRFPLFSSKSDVSEILLRCLEGKTLSKSAAYELIRGNTEEAVAVIMTAGLIRDRRKGRKVSYSRKVFLPLTNLCRDKCGYCTFRKDPWDKDAKTMTKREVLEVVKAGEAVRCKEALLLLGDRPEVRYEEARTQLREFKHRTMIEYLRDCCEMIIENSRLLPHSNPGVMTKSEMADLRETNVSMGLMLENVSERLCDVGGPHEFAMSKRPKVRLKTIRSAGELRIAFTTGILIGIGETWEERIDSLFAIKELHEQFGHIQEIIIQNFRRKEGTQMHWSVEPSVNDMSLTIALARLIFLGSMNIQAPPNLTSDSYDSFLEAGINDWGGISPVTIDFVNPEAPWPQIAMLRNESENRGFEFRERLAVYPEFLRKEKGFVPTRLQKRVDDYVDFEGFIKGGMTG